MQNDTDNEGKDDEGGGGRTKPAGVPHPPPPERSEEANEPPPATAVVRRQQQGLCYSHYCAHSYGATRPGGRPLWPYVTDNDGEHDDAAAAADDDDDDEAVCFGYDYYRTHRCGHDDGAAGSSPASPFAVWYSPTMSAHGRDGEYAEGHGAVWAAGDSNSMVTVFSNKSSREPSSSPLQCAADHPRRWNQPSPLGRRPSSPPPLPARRCRWWWCWCCSSDFWCTGAAGCGCCRLWQDRL